ncbi:hypothetical protein ACFYWH_03440 [Streptomyces sp. NPDC003737]|uniref:hypothetical protein n=1 Tax=Streptomyces sp. NPDC003737 TaxID=3364685 RepID=UPI003699CCAE
MARFVRWYGSNPLHLLVPIYSFALTAYAMVRLFAIRPLAVAVWFVGAAIVHDLVLLPLYSIAGLTVPAVLRHRTIGVPQLPWINHLRVPAFLSGVLLLVWFPLVFGLSMPYSGATGLSGLVTAGKNMTSCVWCATTGLRHLRQAEREARPIQRGPRPRSPWDQHRVVVFSSRPSSSERSRCRCRGGGW